MRKIILALAVALGLLVLVMHQHASQATMNRTPARKIVVSDSSNTPAARNSVPSSLKPSKTHTRKIVVSDSSNTPAARNSVPSSLKPSRQLGYVLPLGYGGYQGRGCDGVLSVQCWLKSFNLPMMVVEPLIQDSQFVATGRHKSGVLSFSDLFDIDHFNKLTTKRSGYAQLSKWDDFIQKSPKDVIYVIVRGSSNAHQPGIHIEWETGQTGECNKEYSELKFLEQLGYCVVKVVTSFIVKPTPFTANEMNDIVFDTWKPDKVTIVFSGWSPKYTVPNPNNPKMCQEIVFGEGHSPFTPSQQLMKAVVKYEQLYLKPKTSVAVMIRSEHFIRSLGEQVKKGHVKQSNLNQTVDGHIKRLVTTAKELRKKFPGGKIFVTADVGAYGSFTWGSAVNALGNRDASFYAHVDKAFKEAVVSFHNEQQTFDKWEQSFSKAAGSDDQTYIAALQRVIASRASCLLLFGGGTFELLAFNDYLQSHPKQSEQCWKWIDVRSDFKENFVHQFRGRGDLDISSTADFYKKT